MITHKQNNTRILFYSGFALASMLPLGSVAQAQIVADFNDGNSTTEVDGWTGTAGDGWVDDWNVNNSSDASLTGNVESTNPLTPDSGDYLAVQSSNVNSGSFRRTMIRRQYEDNGSVSLDQSHTVNFLFRIDSGLDDVTRFQLYDTGSEGAASPDTSSAWFIRDGLTERQWGFYSDSGSEQTWTDVRLYEGDTYSFSLNLNPVEETWTGTITNLDFGANDREGNSSFTSDPMNFYGSDVGSSIGGYLHWQVLMEGGSVETPATADWSLDSIQMIPEASSYAPLLGLAAGMFVVTQRRKALEKQPK